MSMNDFRRQQFVLVDGVLKLSDVDDAGFEDPICITDEDCQIVFTSTNMTYRFVEMYRRNIGQAHVISVAPVTHVCNKVCTYVWGIT